MGSWSLTRLRSPASNSVPVQHSSMNSTVAASSAHNTASGSTPTAACSSTCHTHCCTVACARVSACTAPVQPWLVCAAHPALLRSSTPAAAAAAACTPVLVFCTGGAAVCATQCKQGAGAQLAQHTGACKPLACHACSLSVLYLQCCALPAARWMLRKSLLHAAANLR